MSLSEQTTLTLSDTRLAEERMRTALGLAPGATSARHLDTRQAHLRASDGSRQAAAHPFRNGYAPDPASEAFQARLTAAEETLRAEKSERVAAQHALAEAQRMIQQLQTKLAHTEMAGTEALAAERRARVAAEARFEEVSSASLRKAATDQADAPRKRGRPPGKKQVAEMQEPEPVQWWLPKAM